MRLRWLAFAALPVSIASLLGACATAGDPPAAAAGLCSAAAKWEAKCGTPTDACDAKIIDDCSQLQSVMNATVVAAASKCLQNATACSATPTACIAGATQGATPTTAQIAVENDYCMTCQPEGEADCKQAFYSSSSPVASVSSALLELNDTAAADVDKCTTASGCGTTFPSCAQTSIANTLANALDGDNPGVQCVVKAITTSTSADAGAPDSGESFDASTGGDDDATTNNEAGAGTGDGGSDGSTFGEGGAGDDGGTCADDYEPNNSPSAPTQLAMVEDSDNPHDLHAAIAVSGPTSPPADEDWYTYGGVDGSNTTTSADPYASVAAITNLEVCVWAKENGGDAIASGCTSGNPTAYPVAGTAYVGCCSATGTAQMANYGRFGPDDSSTVVMRVRIPATGDVCVGYDLSYAFTH